MGRRGPAPTPTNILKLHGSWRAKINRNEPKMPIEKPPTPRWLTAEGRRVWKEVSKVLFAMRVLTVADRLALARYCDMFARWRAMAEFIAENGEVYPVRNTDGQPVGFAPWPQVAIYNRLANQLTRMEDRFGLSPAARTRIAAAVEGGPAERKKLNRWSGMASA